MDETKDAANKTTPDPTAMTFHRVYWASHGCDKLKGHKTPCRCECGQFYHGTHAYGEDKESAISVPTGIQWYL